MYEHRFFVSLALWYEVAYPSHSTLGWRRGVRTVEWYTATRRLKETGGSQSAGSHRANIFAANSVGGHGTNISLAARWRRMSCCNRCLINVVRCRSRKKKKKLPKRCDCWHQGVFVMFANEVCQMCARWDPDHHRVLQTQYLFLLASNIDLPPRAWEHKVAERLGMVTEWHMEIRKGETGGGGGYICIYVTGVHSGNRRCETGWREMAALLNRRNKYAMQHRVMYTGKPRRLYISLIMRTVKLKIRIYTYIKHRSLLLCT